MNLLDQINQEYHDKIKDYQELKKTITNNINGRICHHNVICLHLIQKFHPVKTYLEIGVHNGTSMSYSISYPGEIKKAIGIDLFENTLVQYKKDKITIERTRDNIGKNNNSLSEIHLIKGNSLEESTFEQVNEVLNSDKVDLLFIDGDHEYLGVSQDFLKYSELVEIGGIIILDDYNYRYPGILKTVEEYIKNNERYEIIGNFNECDLIIKKLY